MRYGSSTTTSYVDVYTYTGSISENNGSYQVSSSMRAIPNPTSSETAIIFSVSKQESFDPVDIIIYDQTGREVRTLLHRSRCIQGDYRLIWDGLDNKDLPVAAGNYFVKIKKGNNTETNQVQIIR